jgi:uncharacterized protein YkwD
MSVIGSGQSDACLSVQRIASGPVQSQLPENRMSAVHTLRAIAFIACLGAAAASSAAPTTKPKPILPTPQQRQEIKTLCRQALRTDAKASRDAVTALREMGDVARKDIAFVANELLRRQQRVVSRAAYMIRYPAKVSHAEAKIAKLRASAWKNIAKLDKGETMQTAKENYNKLISMHKDLAPLYAQRAAVIDAMAMRSELVADCRQAGGQAAKRYTPEAEKALNELAAKSLGMTVSKAAEISAFNGGKGPEAPEARGVWHFIACRQIEGYNAKLWRYMTLGEAENLRMVNDYREALGALRYEIDPRLIQSARRHSKEMTDLSYFSHTSPTPANKAFTDRIRNAGHPSPAGENIAAASKSGAGIFWMWFKSPGHHKNMVNKGNISMGVGKWSRTWTQNMGRGKRVMLTSQADRAKIKIKGKVLQPQRP